MHEAVQLDNAIDVRYLVHPVDALVLPRLLTFSREGRDVLEQVIVTVLLRDSLLVAVVRALQLVQLGHQQSRLSVVVLGSDVVIPTPNAGRVTHWQVADVVVDAAVALLRGCVVPLLDHLVHVGVVILLIEHVLDGMGVRQLLHVLQEVDLAQRQAVLAFQTRQSQEGSQ